MRPQPGICRGTEPCHPGSSADWVLTLNPDVLLMPGFIRNLVEAGEWTAGAGAVCGKLLSIGPGFDRCPKPRIDSTGIFFTPAMRHFDRGWHEPDERYFESMEYVFGASAAAALFRRANDRRCLGGRQFLRSRFLCLSRGCRCRLARAVARLALHLYARRRSAHHVRSVTPANRRSLPAVINMHSVKNRFLMRVKNTTAGVCRRCWAPMIARDLMVLGRVACCGSRRP